MFMEGRATIILRSCGMYDVLLDVFVLVFLTVDVCGVRQSFKQGGRD